MLTSAVPPRNRRVLDGLLRHGCDGDAIDFHVALLDLVAQHLRDEMGGVVVGHVLIGELRGKEVVVHRVLLRDSVAVDGIAIVGPVCEVGTDLAFAGRVGQVGILDGGRFAHLVDAYVAILNGAVSERDNHSKGAEKQHALRCNDQATHLAFGIEPDVLLVGDLIGEQDLLRREAFSLHGLSLGS